MSNDDRVRAGTGFSTHPHRDMEIVTWVLSGRLEHKDSEGNHGEIYPGLAQRMSAGTGIWHSEMNPSAAEDVHFVQMWVPPDTESIRPGYEQSDINADLDRGGLVPVASGQGHDGAVSLRQRDAVLWAGRLKPGEVVAVPDAPHAHVFVAIGGAELEGAGDLGTRRCRPTHRRRLTPPDRGPRRRRGPHLGDGLARRGFTLACRSPPWPRTRNAPDCPSSDHSVRVQPGADVPYDQLVACDRRCALRPV